MIYNTVNGYTFEEGIVFFIPLFFSIVIIHILLVKKFQILMSNLQKTGIYLMNVITYEVQKCFNTSNTLSHKYFGYDK